MPRGGDLLVERDPFNGEFYGDSVFVGMLDTTSGRVRRIVTGSPVHLAQRFPAPSADGSWIYFAGLRRAGLVFGSPAQFWGVYRVHLDGADPELLTAAPTDVYWPMRAVPAPSPDGRSVALLLGYNQPDEGRLTILDLATSNERSLGNPGIDSNDERHRSPRWSPDGQWIAYIDSDRLFVVHPDGSGAHQMGRRVAAVREATEWSPDGRWIVARAIGEFAAGRHGGLLALIDTRTDEVLPLPFSDGLRSPTWLP
jgi:Tol biopolymer transport system component